MAFRHLNRALKGGQATPTTKRRTITLYVVAVYFLIIMGGMLANPMVYKWWYTGQVPIGVDELGYSNIYDLALKSFDIGDLVLGSIFMVMKDIVGAGITTAVMGALLAFSYSVYVIPYGSPTITSLLFVISAAIQGAVLNGMSICFFPLASLPNFPVWLPENTRFMAMNGSFDLSTLTASALINGSESISEFTTQGIFLIGTAIAMMCFGLYFVPGDAHAQEVVAPSVLGVTEMSSDDSAKKTEPTPIEIGFFAELISAPVSIFLISWGALITIKVFVNGPALSTAVSRQYGDDGIWMYILQNLSWVGFLTGLLYGVVADINFAWTFVGLSVVGVCSVWCLVFESPSTVGVAVMLFYIMRGSITGSLFLILPKLLFQSKYEGRVISLVTAAAGLIILLFVNRVIELTTVDGAVYPYDKDYRVILKPLGMFTTPFCGVLAYWAHYSVPPRLAAKSGDLHRI